MLHLARFHVGIKCNEIKHSISPDLFPWWNQIDQDLYLGALPLKERGDGIALKSLGISAVLSIVDSFELDLQAQDWKTVGIVNYQHIAVRDFTSPTVEQLRQAVEWIKTAREKKQTVYIHCKSGKGRSVTVVMCFLFLHGLTSGQKFIGVAETLDHIKSKRPIAKPSDTQLEQVYRMVYSYKK